MIVTEPFVYKDESGQCEGVYEGTLSWDDALSEPRPGVMVAPTFRGQMEFETEKAQALAEMGYVGFAIDIYGQGIRASTPEEASELMATLNDDRDLLRRRMQLATQVLGTHDRVNADQLAAIGFCFGGKCVLDLARSGALVRGVVSFHGIYDPPDWPIGLNGNGEISASILALHGWEDPLGPREQMTAFADEMTAAGADWQVHVYGHTAHAFTNPAAQSPSTGMYFQPAANRRGWRTMSHFLADCFE